MARAAEQGSQLVIIQMDTPGGLDVAMRSVIKAILTAPVPVATFVAPGGARAASAGTYILYASHIAAMAPGTNLGAATPVMVGPPGSAPGPGPGQPTAPEPGGQTPGQAPDLLPGQVPDQLPDQLPDQVPDPLPDQVPDPLPDQVPDQVPDKPPAQGGELAGTAMERKQVNDAAAYIRGLAQLRDRNAVWAERAVRESVSLSATEALKQNEIEFVATDVAALAAQLHGTTVDVLGRELVLDTAGAPLVYAPPDWRTRALASITDPSIALILMTIGVYGLLFEFMSPGAIFPGVIGALCLVVGLYGLQMLPVNYAGLGLILLGLAFMIGEAFLPSFGVLGLGGIAAFVAGSLILIDTESPDFGVPVTLIVTLAVASALALAAIAGVAVRTRRLSARSATEALIGTLAKVLDDPAWANVNGETWRIVSAVPLRPGQTVRVLGRKGAHLEVGPVEPPFKGVIR
jgi:membrane-bound serine protease (ClpP class)